jgi:SAM-dependent methyltransferase
MSDFSSYRCHSTALLSDLVLDIGSGDNPHPRADVILDLSQSDEHRWAALRLDSRLVFGDVENLPFRNKEFDVALCFHVLEHVRDPVRAVREIQRVARRGICEMPTLYGDLFFQPYFGHRWVFARDGAQLIFAQHPVSIACIETVETTLFLLKHNRLFRAAFLADTQAFRVRFHWSDTIPIKEVSLAEVVDAAATSIKSAGEAGAITETLSRFYSYTLDRSSAAWRRAFRKVI